MKMNTNKLSSSIMSNPLVVIILLILGLIVILAILRPASPFLNFGFGLNAHIGDLKGSVQFEAFDNGQPAFVMYYAEWCGHCKKTKPDFQKLIESYKGPVKIMMVDCEAPENAKLVKDENIKGFPTIRYYPNGLSDGSVESYQEYSGNRTLFDFNQYLNNVTGVLDKQPDNAAPV
jgi:thiol-disulfide isomerase/thioredoxin